jgi:hypothetical protein
MLLEVMVILPHNHTCHIKKHEKNGNWDDISLKLAMESIEKQQLTNLYLMVRCAYHVLLQPHV